MAKRKSSAVATVIRNEDCREGLKKLAPGSVHLCCTDPPFNVAWTYDCYDDKKSAAEYLKFTQDWLAGVHRVLHPNGACWVAIGDEYVSEVDVTAKQVGFYKRAHVIWYYTFGVNCTRSFTRSHTHLLYYVRNPKKFTFNSTEARVPSARQTEYADTRANAVGRLPDNTWILRPQEAPWAFAKTDDTWHCARVCGTYKSRRKWMTNQMPEQVIGRIVRLCSLPGDIVLDPFTGSGTTLAVAKKLGRRPVGFELSPQYSKHAEARVQAANAGDPLDGPDIQGGE